MAGKSTAIISFKVSVSQDQLEEDESVEEALFDQSSDLENAFKDTVDQHGFYNLVDSEVKLHDVKEV